MRPISSIIKGLLVVLVFLASHSLVHAQNRWTTPDTLVSAQTASASKAEKSIKAASTAVVQGTFYLVNSSCNGTADAFNALFYLKQRGTRFTLHDSAGLRLSGRGSRNGFQVSARRLDRRNGMRITHVISAGPVLYDYTANFRYTATLRRISDNASCQAVFEGTLNIDR